MTSKIIFLTLICTCVAWGNLPATQRVVVNTTAGKTWYHLKLNLTKGDFRLSYPDEYFDPRWPDSTSGECYFNEGSGYFQIFIRKSIFPVPAPNCQSEWLKVTMDGRSNNEADVTTKRVLWEQLNEVSTEKRESVDVVLELNPYVSVESENPLVLRMEYCNLYFRTAWGAYIDNTLPLR